MFIVSLGIGHRIDILPLLITHDSHHVAIEITVLNRLWGRDSEDSRDHDSKGE